MFRESLYTLTAIIGPLGPFLRNAGTLCSQKKKKKKKKRKISRTSRRRMRRRRRRRRRRRKLCPLQLWLIN
jgi:hypothetical protein